MCFTTIPKQFIVQSSRKGCVMWWDVFRMMRWTRRAPAKQVHFRPNLESLEEREVPAVVDPTNFTESVFVNGGANLSVDTGLAWAPDGSNRLFVTRKSGEVRIIQNGTLLSTPFTTLNPIFTTGECGLLGITFDRNYVNNHFIYLFVTVSNSEQ